MDIRKIASPLLLLITAMIWGFGFVAQKAGMDYLGPYGFTMVRFFLGACCVLVFSLILDNRKRRSGKTPEVHWLRNGRPDRTLVKAGVFSGVFLWALILGLRLCIRKICGKIFLWHGKLFCRCALCCPGFSGSG